MRATHLDPDTEHAAANPRLLQNIKREAVRL